VVMPSSAVKMSIDVVDIKLAVHAGAGTDARGKAIVTLVIVTGNDVPGIKAKLTPLTRSRTRR